MFMSVSDTIGRENASALLSHTHSCSHLRMAMNYGRASTTQCGVCLGCLVRRGAFIASGLEDQSTYLVNDLDQERLGKFLRSTPGADIETCGQLSTVDSERRTPLLWIFQRPTSI